MQVERREHYTKVVADDGTKTYRCNYCDFETSDHLELGQHLNPRNTNRCSIRTDWVKRKPEATGSKQKGQTLSKMVEKAPQESLVDAFQEWFGDITKKQAEELFNAARAAQEWKDAAELRGFDLPTYIHQTCEFYENYVSYVREIKTENRVYEALLESLFPLAIGETARLKEMKSKSEIQRMGRMLFYRCMLNDKTPDSRVLNMLMRGG